MRFHFEDKVLDAGRRELLSGGARVAVEPQVFDLLLYLVENRDRVVSKDDMLNAVWHGRIVSESALTSRINAARKAVGDSGEAQRLIRTLPRKGFRFVGAVSDGPEAAAPASARPEAIAVEPAPALALPDRPSIAVLPFQNLSGDPQQDYFADGMVEDIITALSRFKSLFVIARNSSFAYKGRAVDTKRIGRELGVRYLLEGSVRKAGDRVRIGGQLIEAATGAHLWADRFDGTLNDVFELQDHVTARVVSEIAPRVERQELDRARRKPIHSLDAYDCFLRGLVGLHERTRDSCEEALRLSYRAIDLDPDFASPYGIAARCYVARKTHGWTDDRDWDGRETRRLALAVQRIGRDDGYALACCGSAMAFVCHEYDVASAMVEQATAANPNLAAAWQFRGTVNIYVGNYADGISQLHHVLRMSPMDPELYSFESFLGWGYLLQRQYADAILWTGRARARRSGAVIAMRVGAAAHALSGDLPAARQAVADLLRAQPGVTVRHLMAISPFRRHEDLERVFDALRLAGLPE